MGRRRVLYTGMFPGWGSVAGRATPRSIFEVEVTTRTDSTFLPQTCKAPMTLAELPHPPLRAGDGAVFLRRGESRKLGCLLHEWGSLDRSQDLVNRYEAAPLASVPSGADHALLMLLALASLQILSTSKLYPARWVGMLLPIRARSNVRRTGRRRSRDIILSRRTAEDEQQGTFPNISAADT